MEPPMSYEQERASIEIRFAAQWVAGSPAAPRTPIAYETAPFTPPANAPWVRLTIRSGEAQQASIGDPGANAFRHAGAIMVQIFVPKAGSPVASRRAAALADHTTAIFRAATFDGIACRAPYASGGTDDDPWYMVTVTVPFSRDSLL
jgi:hypothetical protein